jgi:hypothetical protein
MWRRKKFIIVAVLATTVLLVGSIGGLAFAQTGSTDNTTSGKTLLARVATILGIDQQKVENAFAQAQREMRDEALDSYLKNLVDQGKITQQQADQYKAWVKSSPDMSQYQQKLKEWQQARPATPPELKDWQTARPNIPLPGGFGGHGFRDGMKWGGERYFWGK